VLAGMLTSLLGQGLMPFDAARAAVYLHGLAGDIVAARGSETSLIASDVAECLPAAFRHLLGR
jgi:NAD(P)H-hydrate repair Nnr-like enzyme with NAD(P)H-hydrate dehydratase domain